MSEELVMPKARIFDSVESQGNPQDGHWTDHGDGEYAGRFVVGVSLESTGSYTPVSNEWEWDIEEWKKRENIKMLGFRLAKERDKNEVFDKKNYHSPDGSINVFRKVGGRLFLNEKIEVILRVRRDFRDPNGKLVTFEWGIRFYDVEIKNKLPICKRSFINPIDTNPIEIPPKPIDPPPEEIKPPLTRDCRDGKVVITHVWYGNNYVETGAECPEDAITPQFPKPVEQNLFMAILSKYKYHIGCYFLGIATVLAFMIAF